MMKIGTHNGAFHCDEALACAILKALPQYKEAEIIRTRDQAVLDTCDIVVDVGGVFDDEKKRWNFYIRTNLKMVTHGLCIKKSVSSFNICKYKF